MLEASHIDYHERLALCSAHVTLDGAKALIMGARNDFATVVTLDGRLRVEFSWETVKRVVANGGRFKV